MPLVTYSWSIERVEMQVARWRVYAGLDREQRGDFVIEVPSERRSILAEAPPGEWWVRVVALTKGGSEEPWQRVEPVRVIVTGHEGEIPCTPTKAAALPVDLSVATRLVLDPPSRDCPPAKIQVIEGPDEWRGKLVGEAEAPPAGPGSEDGQRMTSVPFALEGSGVSGGRTLLARALSREGRPGASVSVSAIAPERHGFEPVAIASVDGSTLVNFSVPGVGDVHEYDATDGLRLLEMPAVNDSAAWTALGTVAAGALASHHFAPYFGQAKVESDEVDLGASRTFVLELHDELQRKTAIGAFASLRVCDLGIYPAFPSTRQDVRRALDGYSPAWLFHETTAEGKPRQPLRNHRWEYVISDSPAVPHADADYLPYVPGAWVTGRYVRVRLVVDDLGFHQVISPRLWARAMIPAKRTGSEYHRQVGTSPVERWYPAGQANAGVLTTGALVADTMYAMPFVSPRGGVLDNIGFSVTTGVPGSVGRLGIYRATSRTSLYPDALVVDAGPLTGDAPGAKTVPISVPLEPDTLYWLVLYASGTPPTVRCLELAGAFPILGISSALAAPGVGWRVVRAYDGTMPATFPASAAVITAVPVPMIAARYSG